MSQLAVVKASKSRSGQDDRPARGVPILLAPAAGKAWPDIGPAVSQSTFTMAVPIIITPQPAVHLKTSVGETNNHLPYCIMSYH